MNSARDYLVETGSTREQGRSDPQHEIATRKRVEEKVAWLQDFNQMLVESSGDCILLVDAEGRLLSLNKKGCQLLDVADLDGWLNKPWARLFPDADAQTMELFRSSLSLNISFEARARTINGAFKWWLICFTPMRSENGDRTLIIARDITAQTLVERALRQSEEAFRKVFEENPIGILIADLNYRITKVNNALCGMLGFSEQELCGVDFRSLFPKTGPGQATEKFTHLLHGDIRSFGAESGFQTKRKEIVWGHFTTSLLRDTENNPSAFLQMVESIDERKKSQEQLLGYQQQLQSLTSELSLSEERERRRIATNLHDRIGQTLAFARLKLGTLAQASNSKALEEVRELIEEAIGDTRSLTFELSPPVLYELGLVAAVEWLARKIQQEHSILTRFHDDGQPKPLDEDFRVVLFQAVRELLVNVVKHARASHAQVLMRRDADALRIIIEDDGAGFDEAKLNIARDSARSFGLFNIRERLEYLGGRLKIRSEIGRGTRVTLFAPLKLAQNATTEVKP